MSRQMNKQCLLTEDSWQTRAETIQQEREEVYATLQCAAFKYRRIVKSRSQKKGGDL